MSDNKPSLSKQLIGAAAGAGVALALYGIYTWAEPHIDMAQAWLTVPQIHAPESSRVADTSTEERNVLSIARRAREIAEQFSGNPEDLEESYTEDADPIDTENTADTISRRNILIPDEVVAEELAPVKHKLSVDLLPPPPPTEEPKDEVSHSGAANLPDSGLGLWLAFSISLVAVAYLKRRRLTLLCAQCMQMR